MTLFDSVQWYDYFRFATALAGLIGLWFVAHGIRNTKQYLVCTEPKCETRLRDVLWLLGAYLFTQAVAALETVAVDGSYKYSIFLSFGIALFAVRIVRSLRYSRIHNHQ